MAYWLLNARDRVDGLPSCIRLPLDGPDDLSDPAVVAAIVRDAEALNARLEQARRGLMIAGHPPGTWRAALALWHASPAYRGLSPNTRRVYASGEKAVGAYFAGLRSDKVERATPKTIGVMLDEGGLADASRRAFLSVLSNVMSFAVEEGWIPDNPVRKVRKRRGAPSPSVTRPVALWTPADVDEREALALEIGWLGGAVMIRGMWDSMARQYDTTTWMRSHWDSGRRLLAYETEKTDRLAMGVMSERFAELVARSNGLYLVTRPDGTPYDPERLNRQMSEDVRTFQKAAAARGLKPLGIRHIRHSAQTHGGDLGLTAEQMLVNNSHANGKMARARYIRENEERALANAIARGIVAG